MKFFDTALRQTPKILSRPADNHGALLRLGAHIGGTLFGPVPAGHRREFFCLDEHTWVWHEEWSDAKGKRCIITTRYDVSPQGILKSQNGGSYLRVGADEAHHLQHAAHLYHERFGAELQRIAHTS